MEKRMSDNIRRSEQVAHMILTMIEDGRLHEGDKLPSEPEFAKQLGISRGILREGLAQLKAQGVISRKPKDGTYVLPLGGDKNGMTQSTQRMIQVSSFRNIMEMRSAIEQKAAVLAVERATNEELEDLRDIVLAANRHAGEDDLDFYFHYRLVEISGNSIFMGIVNTYFEQIRQIRDSNLRDPSADALIRQEHMTIMEALFRRDKAAAAQAVENHMDQIWERWRQRNCVEEN